MALQQASLGQLSNIPTGGYIPANKKPKIWEQALASFLTGAAMGTAQGLTQNAFAKDFAPEGQKTSFWKKPFQGAAVSEKEYLQNKGQDWQKEFLGMTTDAQKDVATHKSGLDLENAANQYDMDAKRRAAEQQYAIDMLNRTQGHDLYKFDEGLKHDRDQNYNRNELSRIGLGIQADEVAQRGRQWNDVQGGKTSLSAAQLAQIQKETELLQGQLDDAAEMRKQFNKTNGTAPGLGISSVVNPKVEQAKEAIQAVEAAKAAQVETPVEAVILPEQVLTQPTPPTYGEFKNLSPQEARARKAELRQSADAAQQARLKAAQNSSTSVIDLFSQWLDSKPRIQPEFAGMTPEQAKAHEALLRQQAVLNSR